MTPNTTTADLAELTFRLRHIEKPSRYCGGEWNQVKKDLTQVRLTFALAYPDAYEVGMSHLGLRILYHVLNERPDVACERAFCPRLDMAGLIRREGDLLRSLESRLPLRDFDLVGITLQHELTYANVLFLLDLGGVPLRRADRAGRDPVVLGGGPCALNPEPMAEFFDAFVIGEGEEVVGEIVECYVSWAEDAGPREQRMREHRDDLLRRLARIAGVYVPSLYAEQKQPDGRRWAGAPLVEGVPERVTRRIVADLESAPFPTRPIVPFAEIVHDRAMVEIMRGCGRGCRFCQAGIIYRPARIRSLETLKHQCDRLVANTGYEEIAPLALSCPDYPHIEALLEYMTTAYAQQHVSASLPSLRVDQFSVELAERVQRPRKSGLTLAPEAGSERLRRAINKNVTEQDILDAATTAFEWGWQRLKLYFMIGLPTETDEDVLEIARITNTVRDLGNEVLGPRKSRLTIALSVNAFVPKPHTPFQWARQAGPEEVTHKLGLLKGALRDRRVKLSWSHPQQSLLEGVLARGGRELGEVVLGAYRRGSVFDSWCEHFDYQRWQAAFAEVGLDPEQLATREWQVDEPLPWGHIDAGVAAEYLEQEAQRAAEGLMTPDCFLEACSNCGVQRLVACPAEQQRNG